MPFTEEDITKNVIGRCQLTTDSGKKCGSGYVDDKMEDLLIKILFHGAKDMSVKRKKEAVAPLMVQFIDNFKVNAYLCTTIIRSSWLCVLTIFLKHLYSLILVNTIAMRVRYTSFVVEFITHINDAIVYYRYRI